MSDPLRPLPADLEEDQATNVDKIRLTARAMQVLGGLAAVKAKHLGDTQLDGDSLDEAVAGLAAIAEARAYVRHAQQSLTEAETRTAMFAEEIGTARTTHNSDRVAGAQQPIGAYATTELEAQAVAWVAEQAVDGLELERAALVAQLSFTTDVVRRHAIELRLENIDDTIALKMVQRRNEQRVRDLEELVDIDNSFTGMFRDFWLGVSRQNAAIQRGRARRRHRQKVLRVAGLLAYAVSFVLAGVVVDQIVGLTPWGGFAVSALLALALWALDKYRISRWLERGTRTAQLNELALDVALAHRTLMGVRELEGSMRHVARPLGLTTFTLVDRQLFAEE